MNKSQTTGFGGMLSFEVDSEETAKQVLEGIQLIQFAESLGGTESLLTYPVTQTHPDLKPEDAERKGNNTFVTFGSCFNHSARAMAFF